MGDWSLENLENLKEEPERKYVETRTLLILAVTGIFLGVSLITPFAHGDNISYDNISDAKVTVYNLYGIIVGTIDGKWTFAVDTSNNQFYLNNQNTFFYTHHSSAWLWSSDINNLYVSTTNNELYATYIWSVSSALSSISGSTINQVSLNPGNVVNIYIEQYGQVQYNNDLLLPVDVSLDLDI
ncbi:MAG: hypothetical protein ACP5F1_04090 [Thermoplasmata archaeon]|nr:hypothetical protein [Thermoplasmata archaeon]